MYWLYLFHVWDWVRSSWLLLMLLHQLESWDIVSAHGSGHSKSVTNAFISVWAEIAESSADSKTFIPAILISAISPSWLNWLDILAVILYWLVKFWSWSDIIAWITDLVDVNWQLPDHVLLDVRQFLLIVEVNVWLRVDIKLWAGDIDWSLRLRLKIWIKFRVANGWLIFMLIFI